MSQPLVWTFFYGSYISFDVLAEAEFLPVEYEVAHIDGFRDTPASNDYVDKNCEAGPRIRVSRLVHRTTGEFPK